MVEVRHWQPTECAMDDIVEMLRQADPASAPDAPAYPDAEQDRRERARTITDGAGRGVARRPSPWIHRLLAAAAVILLIGSAAMFSIGSDVNDQAVEIVQSDDGRELSSPEQPPTGGIADLDADASEIDESITGAADPTADRLGPSEVSSGQTQTGNTYLVAIAALVAAVVVAGAAGVIYLRRRHVDSSAREGRVS